MPLCPTPPLVKTECINCNGINFWSYYTSRVVLLESPVARILAPCLPMLLKERSRLVSAVSLDRTCPITWQLNQTWSNTQWIQVGHHDIKLLQCKRSTGTGYCAIDGTIQAPPTSTDWELRPQRDRSRCVTLENVWEKNVTSCLDILSSNCTREKNYSFFDWIWI